MRRQRFLCEPHRFKEFLEQNSARMCCCSIGRNHFYPPDIDLVVIGDLNVMGIERDLRSSSPAVEFLVDCLNHTGDCIQWGRA